jgi:hypothetical protein
MVMNERIKQLALQAGIYNLELTDETEYWILEKFAELIVKECADIAYDYDAPKMSGPGMIIAGRIETHFGVEE